MEIWESLVHMVMGGAETDSTLKQTRGKEAGS